MVQNFVFNKNDYSMQPDTIKLFYYFSIKVILLSVLHSRIVFISESKENKENILTNKNVNNHLPPKATGIANNTIHSTIHSASETSKWKLY